MDRIGKTGPLGVARFIYHLPSFGRLLARLWRDRRVSWVAKSMPMLALLYVLLPIDFITDWIPVLGQLDDAAVIMLALRTFVRLIPQEVVREHVAAIDSGAA